MSKLQQLSHSFERAVNTTAYAATCLATALSTGAGVYFGLDNTPDTTANVSITEKVTAQAKTKQLADTILIQEQKIRFDAKTLDNMQTNAGNGKEPLAQQKAVIDAMYAQLTQDREAQNTRLANLRREFLFNPALSETAATTLYIQLWEKANDSGYTNIRSFFPPFKDALTFRDECKLARNMGNQTPQTATNEQALEIARCGNNMDTVHDYKEIAYGVMSGFGTIASFALVGSFATAMRRRVDRKTEENKAKTTDRRLEIVVHTHKNP